MGTILGIIAVIALAAIVFTFMAKHDDFNNQ
jgi:hypothetical protein